MRPVLKEEWEGRTGGGGRMGMGGEGGEGRADGGGVQREREISLNFRDEISRCCLRERFFFRKSERKMCRAGRRYCRPRPMSCGACCSFSLFLSLHIEK
jgi:hypothetical protein